MNLLLTAAAATAAAAASGPVGWVVLGIVGAIAAGAAVIGLVGKQREEKKALQNMNELLDEANKIKEENGIKNETPTEAPKEEIPKYTRINNGLTGEFSAVSNTNRTAISKGNIIDNYMNGTRAQQESASTSQGWLSGIIGNYDKSQFYEYPNVETKPVDKPVDVPVDKPVDVPVDKPVDIPVDKPVDVPVENKDIIIPPGDIIDNVDTPIIEDKTDENLEEEVPTTIKDEWEKWYKIREQQWLREDAIRRETQEREDTAYQRAIADMKKAGINPNIFGVDPAESGGGITQASMPDMSIITNQMNIDLKELQQLIDQNFQGNENDLNRLKDTFTSILSAIAMIVAFKK